MLWRTESVASQGLDEMDGRGAPIEFSSELAAKFQTAILLPLMSRAVVAPGEVHAFIDLIRDKLDALSSLLPSGSASAAANCAALRGSPKGDSPAESSDLPCGAPRRELRGGTLRRQKTE